MSNIYITSDWHFNHDKSFIYEPRGYKNVYDMNVDLILKYNSIVSWNDIIYVLGDCCLGDTEKGINCIKQLNGYKHLIAGNHCTDKRLEMYKEANIFESISFCERIKYNHWTFLLNHYPILTENYQDRHKVISLCGHSHTKDPFLHWDNGLIYHVEVDAHNGYPVSIDQIESDIRKKLNI